MITTVTPHMRFHHNGDFSGEIAFFPPGTPDDTKEEFFETSCAVLVRALLGAENKTHVDIMACRLRREEMTTVTLPIVDIQELLAGRVQSERIEKLENMSTEELDALGRQDEYQQWAKEK